MKNINPLEFNGLETKIIGIKIHDYKIELKQMLKKYFFQKSKLLVIIIPALLLMLFGICLNSMILPLISSILVIWSTNIIDLVETILNFKFKDYKIQQLNSSKITTKEISNFLTKGLNQDLSQYYTEEYQIELQCDEEDDLYEDELTNCNPFYAFCDDIFNTKLEEEELEKQDNSELYNLTKEETLVQIAGEIDAYYYIYQLPPFNINNRDWTNFFDEMYGYFQLNGVEDKFYLAMSEITRECFSKAIVKKYRDIKLEDFINSLYCLREYSFEETQIFNIKQEFLNRKSISKIINLHQYKTKRLKKDYEEK